MVKAEEVYRAVTQAAPLEAYAFHMLSLIAYQSGRLEEAGIGADFLGGLNGYYSAFPQVLKSKYDVPVMTLSAAR